MAKKHYLLPFIICSIFIFSVAIAQDVKIYTSVKEATVTSEAFTVLVTIKNNQQQEDSFSLTVFPTLLSGVRADLDRYVVDAFPNSNATAKLLFSIPSCTKEFTQTYEITAKSVKNPLANATEKIDLTIKGKGPVCITNFNINKETFDPEESIKIKTTLTNADEDNSPPYTLEIRIKSGDNIVNKFENSIKSIKGKESKIFISDYTFDKLASPGQYVAEVALKNKDGNVVNLQGLDFSVNAVADKISKERSVAFGILAQTIAIKVRNDGNVPSIKFTLAEIIPNYLKNLINPKTEPSSVALEGNNVIYNWNFDSLQPGEERIVVYEISVVGLWLAIVIVILFSGFSLKYIFTPKVFKKYKHVVHATGEREIVVSIDARNRSSNEIKDVIVRDMVPPIAEVVERFDTLKPNVKKVEGGTILTWRIDSLKPREDRVLTYRIRSTMEIHGELHLPKAYMSYFDKKQQKRSVVSKSVYIKKP